MVLREISPEPCKATAEIPATIIPPLIISSMMTKFDFALNEIANAIIDKITAPPPNTLPLIASLILRNP